MKQMSNIYLKYTEFQLRGRGEEVAFGVKSPDTRKGNSHTRDSNRLIQEPPTQAYRGCACRPLRNGYQGPELLSSFLRHGFENKLFHLQYVLSNNAPAAHGPVGDGNHFGDSLEVAEFGIRSW